MPLGLHEKCRSKLREALAAALSSIEVENGIFPRWRSVRSLLDAEKILPQTGSVREQIVSCLGDFPLTEFVIEVLGLELHHNRRYESGTLQKLVEIEGYRDVGSLAQRLVDEFESLPWSYQISIPLPDSLEELVPTKETEANLSPAIKIIRMNDILTSVPRNALSLFSEVPGFHLTQRIPEAAQQETQQLYFQMTTEGFVGRYGGTPAAHIVESRARSFIGICLALSLLQISKAYVPPPQPSSSFLGGSLLYARAQQSISAYVYRQAGGGRWVATTDYALSDSLSRGIGSLKTAVPSVPPKEKSIRAAALLESCGVAFRSGAHAAPILLAAQWLFDSYLGEDDLLAFVQSMVVMEILFGNKDISDKIGISELIASRFSYAVGRTHRERALIFKDFKDIYEVRSKILHSGKARLAFEDRDKFAKLKWMCQCAISNELRLLKAAGSPKGS